MNSFPENKKPLAQAGNTASEPESASISENNLSDANKVGEVLSDAGKSPAETSAQKKKANESFKKPTSILRKGEAAKYVKKSYGKMIVVGLLKAAVFGLIVGLAANFITAFATWFSVIRGLWLSLAVGFGAFVLSTAAFYFLFFRPSDRKLAKKTDSLGLDERMITMMELQGDDSAIAKIQRKDALEKIATFDNKKIKFRVPTVALSFIIALFVFASGMTTVTALSSIGYIRDGSEIIRSWAEEDEPVYCSVTYMTDGGGEIDGDADQVVIYGEDAFSVTAVAEEGWGFAGWYKFQPVYNENGEITDYEQIEEDEEVAQNPERTDKEIQIDTIVIALFQEGQGGGGGGGGGEGEPGDEPQDQPPEGGSGGDPSEGDPSPGASGSYEENNYIIDGKTYYRDELPKYYDEILRMLEEGDYPPELREYLEAYLKTIE